MVESALKKGEPRFILFKAISSGIKWNIQATTVSTGKIRKYSYCPAEFASYKEQPKIKHSKSKRDSKLAL